MTKRVCQPTKDGDFERLISEKAASRSGVDNSASFALHTKAGTCCLLIAANDNHRARAHMPFLAYYGLDTAPSVVVERFGRVLEVTVFLTGFARRQSWAEGKLAISGWQRNGS